MNPKDRGFLARWSARKRAAAHGAASEPLEAKTSPPAQTRPPPEDQAASDPARLPPLDSISALSDVRAFLAEGVPAELKRAALRRAWEADPAIRDFVGLSENAWDFNAPESLAGFGALSGEAAKKLLAQATGQVDEPPAQQEQRTESDVRASPDEPGMSTGASETALGNDDTVAGHEEPPRAKGGEKSARRHGSAIPKS
ncbi:MAG TPA: DUF3306 domain-containing protein [Xanthobacteraceae bacterium]|nr:DUF3306 domain-containing protein [Xanthobacteraceae bacterium]